MYTWDDVHVWRKETDLCEIFKYGKGRETVQYLPNQTVMIKDAYAHLSLTLPKQSSFVG